MAWTKRQEIWMKMHYPEKARRVMSQPGYRTIPEPQSYAPKAKPRKR